MNSGCIIARFFADGRGGDCNKNALVQVSEHICWGAGGVTERVLPCPRALPSAFTPCSLHAASNRVRPARIGTSVRSAVPVSPTVLAHAWPRMAEHIRIQHTNLFRAARNARAALSLQHSMLMRSGSSHMRPPLLLPAAWWQARTCRSQTAGAHFYSWNERVWCVWSLLLFP